MMYRFVVVMVVVLGSSAIVHSQNKTGEVPFACQLSDAELAQRMVQIKNEIRSGVQSVQELKDGYEFTFPGTNEWAHRLFEFIDVERGCCPFFKFHLILEEGKGPIRLGIRGREGVKAIIETMQLSGSR